MSAINWQISNPFHRPISDATKKGLRVFMHLPSLANPIVVQGVKIINDMGWIFSGEGRYAVHVSALNDAVLEIEKASPPRSPVGFRFPD